MGVKSTNPVSIYLLKVNNRNTRTRYEIRSELTIKTPERQSLRTYFTPCSGVSIVNFEQVNAHWECSDFHCCIRYYNRTWQ